MKKSYNKIQESYMVAKANIEALKEQEEEIDRQYIADHNIINIDGSIPKLSYMIDDDETADKAIEECGEIIESSGVWSQILKAREILKIAEENLIQYGLNIMPTKYAREKEILKKAIKENYKIRIEFLETTLKLDVRTVTNK